MDELKIDFAPRTACRAWHAARPGARVLLLAAVAVGGVELVALQRGVADLDAADAARQRAQARLATPADRAPVSARGFVTADRAAAVDAAVGQLNLPWGAVFDAVESATPDGVALLSLEPDAKNDLIRIVAEAGSIDDMLRYVERLKARPSLAGVFLVKHEVNANDSNLPLRFQIEARWRLAP